MTDEDVPFETKDDLRQLRVLSGKQYKLEFVDSSGLWILWRAEDEGFVGVGGPDTLEVMIQVVDAYAHGYEDCYTDKLGRITGGTL